jgi:hypothetical protein
MGGFNVAPQSIATGGKGFNKHRVPGLFSRLGVGCSVLDIEANANIQCRISNSECPTGKCASSMIKVVIFEARIGEKSSLGKKQSAQHKTV